MNLSLADFFLLLPLRRNLRQSRTVSSRNQRSGGEGGIRTPDTLSGMPVFKTGAINRSATSPQLLQFYYTLRGCMKQRMGARRRLSCSVWVHQYLAGFAGFQPRHGFGKILHRDAISDYGMKIEASALEQ